MSLSTTELNDIFIFSTTDEQTIFENIIPYEGQEGDPINLVMGIIASCIIILLQSIFMVKSCIIDYKTKRTNKKPLRLAIAIFSANIIVSIIAIIQTILYYVGSDSVNITLSIGAFLNSIIVSLLYSFMILRLYQTFNETLYEVKPAVLWLHIVLIVYVAIGGFFFPFVLLQDVGNDTKVIFIIIILIPFCMGLTHLIHSFNYKLFQLVLLQRQSLTTNSNDTQQNLDERQLKLLKTIRKHTILGIFIILAQLIIMFVGVLIYGLSDKNVNEISIGYWIITDICIIMETTSLFIGFSDNNNRYICLCKYCDNLCSDICINCAKKSIKSKDKENVKFSVAMTEKQESDDKESDETNSTNMTQFDDQNKDIHTV